jgi:hypothetical protein
MNATPASPAQHLLRDAEPLVAVSIAHLCPSTRLRLADGELSVIAYPNDYGGFVYVDPHGESVPAEPELVPIFIAARATGIVWIKFDADAETVEGFATFGDQETLS